MEVTELDLPGPVARVIGAVNAGNTDAFRSEFAANGWIGDNGRRLGGHSAMLAWSDRELIGANAGFDVTGSKPTDPGVAVDIEVASGGFNGYSGFVSELDGETLRSIVAWAAFGSLVS
jgi:hypothetical protein